VAAVAAATAVVAAEVAEAAEVVARVAVAEVVESASGLEVAVVVDAEDAGWAGGDLRHRVRYRCSLLHIPGRLPLLLALAHNVGDQVISSNRRWLVSVSSD
jgi:hypothetical protein